MAAHLDRIARISVRIGLSMLVFIPYRFKEQCAPVRIAILQALSALAWFANQTQVSGSHQSVCQADCPLNHGSPSPSILRVILCVSYICDGGYSVLVDGRYSHRRPSPRCFFAPLCFTPLTPVVPSSPWGVIIRRMHLNHVVS